MEFSTTKITPNDNVKIPSMNGNNSGYMETDELKEYMNDGLITQSITDGDTTHSPSGDAVNGALNAISDTVSNLITGGTGALKFKRGNDTFALCWGSSDLGGQTSLGSVGTWYYYGVYPQIPYGVTFASTPLIVCNVRSTNLSYVQFATGDTTKIDTVGFGSPQASISNATLYWIAIGKLA